MPIARTALSLGQLMRLSVMNSGCTCTESIRQRLARMQWLELDVHLLDGKLIVITTNSWIERRAAGLINDHSPDAK